MTGPRPARAAARTSIEALTSGEDVFEVFFDRAKIGLALADLSGRYVRVNDTYADLLGRPAEELVGVELADVVGHGPRALVPELLTGVREGAQSEQQYVRPDGTVTWVLHSVATVGDGAGRPAWFAVSAQDITERRRAEQDLRELTAVLTERAVRDPLTGLANRALLEERLRGSLARDARTGGTTGVLFLDLDGFKAVNDSRGHAVGDVVLRTLAERLAAVVRPSDTVARLGGDEFVVLVEGASEAVVEGLAERLRATVAAPVPAAGGALVVGVSIGIALCAAGSLDPQTLLTQADRKMYAAKRGR